jgi:hypothetical protein
VACESPADAQREDAEICSWLLAWRLKSTLDLGVQRRFRPTFQHEMLKQGLIHGQSD